MSVTSSQTTGTTNSGQRFTHDYEPGSYTVKLTATDTEGQTATWQHVVRVFPELEPAIEAEQLDADTWRFTASATGGDGDYLAHRWEFSDGETADGKTVEHTFAGSPGADLTVVDGTTNAVATGWAP